MRAKKCGPPAPCLEGRGKKKSLGRQRPEFALGSYHPTGTRKGAPRDRSGLKVTAVASSLKSGGQEAALVRRHDLGTPPAQATFRIMSVNRSMNTQMAHYTFLCSHARARAHTRTHAHTHTLSVADWLLCRLCCRRGSSGTRALLTERWLSS